MHNTVDTDNAAIVILGKRKWPIPILAAKQNKIIDPLIFTLLPVFEQCRTEPGSIMKFLTASHYEALLEMAFIALTRAHPDFTRAEFMEMPVTLPELIVAFSTIARQTGVFAKGEPGEA